MIDNATAQDFFIPILPEKWTTERIPNSRLGALARPSSEERRCPRVALNQDFYLGSLG
jgi:hypothetical protein